MFSGLWSIADQVKGRSLGQAAPHVYGLGSSAIFDIRQTSSPNNVHGTITTATDTLNETPPELADPRFNTQGFVTTLFQGGSGSWFVLSFGTDTSLTPKAGWDNVTGVGVPNGIGFIHAVTGK
jgi:hypothetical protein